MLLHSYNGPYALDDIHTRPSKYLRNLDPRPIENRSLEMGDTPKSAISSPLLDARQTLRVALLNQGIIDEQGLLKEEHRSKQTPELTDKQLGALLDLPFSSFEMTIDGCQYSVPLKSVQMTSIYSGRWIFSLICEPDYLRIFFEQFGVKIDEGLLLQFAEVTSSDIILFSQEKDLGKIVSEMQNRYGVQAVSISTLKQKPFHHLIAPSGICLQWSFQSPDNLSIGWRSNGFGLPSDPQYLIDFLLGIVREKDFRRLQKAFAQGYVAASESQISSEEADSFIEKIKMTAGGYSLENWTLFFNAAMAHGAIQAPFPACMEPPHAPFFPFLERLARSLPHQTFSALLNVIAVIAIERGSTFVKKNADGVSPILQIPVEGFVLRFPNRLDEAIEILKTVESLDPRVVFDLKKMINALCPFKPVQKENSQLNGLLEAKDPFIKTLALLGLTSSSQSTLEVGPIFSFDQVLGFIVQGDFYAAKRAYGLADTKELSFLQLLDTISLLFEKKSPEAFDLFLLLSTRLQEELTKVSFNKRPKEEQAKYSVLRETLVSQLNALKSPLSWAFATYGQIEQTVLESNEGKIALSQQLKGFVFKSEEGNLNQWFHLFENAVNKNLLSQEEIYSSLELFFNTALQMTVLHKKVPTAFSHLLKVTTDSMRHLVLSIVEKHPSLQKSLSAKDKEVLNSVLMTFVVAPKDTVEAHRIFTFLSSKEGSICIFDRPLCLAYLILFLSKCQTWREGETALFSELLSQFNLPLVDFKFLKQSGEKKVVIQQAMAFLIDRLSNNNVKQARCLLEECVSQQVWSVKEEALKSLKESLVSKEIESLTSLFENPSEQDLHFAWQIILRAKAQGLLLEKELFLQMGLYLKSLLALGVREKRDLEPFELLIEIIAKNSQIAKGETSIVKSLLEVLEKYYPLSKSVSPETQERLGNLTSFFLFSFKERDLVLRCMKMIEMHKWPLCDEAKDASLWFSTLNEDPMPENGYALFSYACKAGLHHFSSQQEIVESVIMKLLKHAKTSPQAKDKLFDTLLTLSLSENEKEKILPDVLEYINLLAKPKQRLEALIECYKWSHALAPRLSQLYFEALKQQAEKISETDKDFFSHPLLGYGEEKGIRELCANTSIYLMNTLLVRVRELKAAGKGAFESDSQVTKIKKLVLMLFEAQSAYLASNALVWAKWIEVHVNLRSKEVLQLWLKSNESHLFENFSEKDALQAVVVAYLRHSDHEEFYHYLQAFLKEVDQWKIDGRVKMLLAFYTEVLADSEKWVKNTPLDRKIMELLIEKYERLKKLFPPFVRYELKKEEEVDLLFSSNRVCATSQLLFQDSSQFRQELSAKKAAIIEEGIEADVVKVDLTDLGILHGRFVLKDFGKALIVLHQYLSSPHSFQGWAQTPTAISIFFKSLSEISNDPSLYFLCRDCLALFLKDIPNAKIFTWNIMEIIPPVLNYIDQFSNADDPCDHLAVDIAMWVDVLGSKIASQKGTWEKLEQLCEILLRLPMESYHPYLGLIINLIDHHYKNLSIDIKPTYDMMLYTIIHMLAGYRLRRNEKKMVVSKEEMSGDLRGLHSSIFVLTSHHSYPQIERFIRTWIDTVTLLLEFRPFHKDALTVLLDDFWKAVSTTILYQDKSSFWKNSLLDALITFLEKHPDMQVNPWLSGKIDGWLLGERLYGTNFPGLAELAQRALKAYRPYS